MTSPLRIFVWALEGEPETLDPAGRQYSERAIRVKWLLFDTLVNIGQNGRSLEPGLAEGWTLSDDGLRVEMRLRRNVLFHDGRPLDAQAVKLSFDRQFRTDLADEKKQVLRALIEDVRVQDEQTLLFRLKYPGFQYLGQRYLFKLAPVSPDAIATRGEELARNPVGTGPFMNPTWLPDRIVLHKNPRYWGGEPKIDEVHFRYIPDGNEAVDALLTGDVDYVPTLSDPDSFEKVLHDTRVKVLMVPGFNVFYLGFHLRKPPFDNPVIRHAVVRALNVHRMALIGRGAATAAAGPLPPHMLGYDPGVRQDPYDPESARRQLQEAGYDGRPVTLVHYGPASFARHLALAVERDLDEVGLKILRQEAPTWSDVVSAAQRGEGDLFIYSWHMRTDDAQGFLRALFHSSNIGVTNLTQYSNPTVDRLLDQPPPHQFSTAVRQIFDDAPMAFLSHWTRVVAHKARVRGLRLNIGVLPQDRLVGVDVGP